MADDVGIETPPEIKDPDEQAHIGRQSITKEQLKKVIQDPNAPEEFDWGDVQAVISDINQWITDTKHFAMASLGIDGYGFELSLGAEAAYVLGAGFTPLGVSILWITDSTTGAHQNNPHFYTFYAESVSVGADYGLSLEQSVDRFYAHRFGNEPVTHDSWTGPVVSVDVEAGAGAIVGGEVSGSYFSSIDYDKDTLTGVLSFGFPKSGWHGVSYSVDVTEGGGFEVSIGVTLVDTNAQLVEQFGRPDVRMVFEGDAPEVPDEDEYHYQKEAAGSRAMEWFRMFGGRDMGLGDDE